MIIVIAVVLCSLEQNIATDPFTDIDFIVLQLGTFSFFKKNPTTMGIFSYKFQNVTDY